MSAGGPIRTRSERVAALELPPGRVGRLLAALRNREVLLRLSFCLLAAIVLWAGTEGWAPPFAYRAGDELTHDVVSRVEFVVDDLEATERARRRARELAPVVYRHDPRPLVEIRAELLNTLNQIVAAEKLEGLSPGTWAAFQKKSKSNAPAQPEPPAADEEPFDQFRKALTAEGALEKVRECVAASLKPLESHGLLDQLAPNHQGSQEKILIYSTVEEAPPADRNYREVAVSDVLMAGALLSIEQQINDRLHSLSVADEIYRWLRFRLKPTLTFDRESSIAQKKEAERSVGIVRKQIPAGFQIASAGTPLDPATLKLLRLEHEEVIRQRPLSAGVMRTIAMLGMYVALYTLCGTYILRREPSLVRNLRRFLLVLAMVVVTVILCRLTGRGSWQAELVPLTLFGMTMTIVYHQELALLLTTAVTLVMAFSLGIDLSECVILMAAVTAAILPLGSVRSRTKLLYIGMVSAVAAFLTTLGVGTLAGRPLYIEPLFAYQGLLWDALRFGLWALIAAGSLMLCLLPFIERLFDVQTDISLMELGDPAHPLLQELVRRAPGTYNHSITVASLAENAAEAIGARALLVRVGAYFHDIGKMLKPGYFVENQGQDGNRHDALMPAMSTLVIIAHVKDGADMARQHGLPDAIIDFIQQHHGTTLVEYFYRRASEQSQVDPNASPVDESSFRYPGPKPQTREAGILMLADAVESASRTLVEPAPARIKSLVDQIVMSRLLDGQFDQCGLTIQEVRTVQESLVKSLTALYHGRVKYPSQQTA